MRYIYILSISILLVSCTIPKNQNLDFLLGQWERQNDTEGRKTYEYWKKSNNNTYQGLGFTLQGQDTVFKENLRIIKIDGDWNLEVIGVNPEPTYFHFTSQTNNSFVCENPENEFPKKIEYIFKDTKLTAIISDGVYEIQFDFSKRKLK